MKRISKIFAIALIGIMLVACGNPTGDNNPPNTDKDDLSVLPVISPAAGDFLEGFLTITITHENPAAYIFYTTDGTDPSDKSSMYTGGFRIIGSKTVKAIAILGTSKSKIATAQYNLNAGKAQSQLGVITGTVGLSQNLSESTREALKNDTVYIYSDDLPGIVKQSKVGEEFVFDGLDTSKSYSFYFANTSPTVFAEGKDARAATEMDKNGKMLISVKAADVTPEVGSGVSLGTVELDLTGTIKGVAKRYGVTGEEEPDHSGTSVFIPGTSYSAFTDEQGQFAISGIPQGIHTIRATYSGYTFVEKRNIRLIQSDESENETIKTELKEELALQFGQGIVAGSVILSDSESGTNEGVSVVLFDTTGRFSYSATTNTLGRWRVVDVYPGTYSIEFSKGEYISQSITDIEVKRAGITSVPSFTLQLNGGKIIGKAEITDSAEKTGIAIIAEKVEETGIGKKFYALTNQSGEFAIDSVTPGNYNISASYAGYKVESITNVYVQAGSQTPQIIFTLSEKTTYAAKGSVVLEGLESGFEGTTVLLTNISNPDESYTLTTDLDGTWTQSGLTDGTYTVIASKSGFITDSSKTLVVGGSPIAIAERIVLRTTNGLIKGDVTLEGAIDNAGISILVTKEDDETKTYSTVTDSNGHYAIAGVTPGSYKVQATKGGYVTGISDPFSVSNGSVSEVNTMQLEVSLRSIMGTVKLEERTDHTGVLINATKTTTTSEIYSALSNKDGFYVLSGMTPGEYVISYSFDAYRSLTSPSVSLESDSSLTLEDVELTRATGTITGIVNLEGRTKHSGIKVIVVGTEYETTTNEDGEYSFTVPSGNYPGGVKFTIDDFQTAQKAETITVLTDNTFGVVTTEMKADANTVSGIIDLLGSDDDSGITLTIDGLEEEKYSATTEADGSWKIDHVPLGQHTLRITATNVPVVTTQVVVEPADIVSIGKFELIPDSATLKGVVTMDDRTDNANIVVTVTTSGKDDSVAVTDSTGAFEVSNILASGTHTVTFSKDGWDSQSLTVSELEPLEVRTICKQGEYVLKDTTAPSITEISLMDGTNYANDPKLKVDITAEDKGSGIEKMAIQIQRIDESSETNPYPANPSWEDYKMSFTYDLSVLPDTIYKGNGTYKIIIKLRDERGNVSDASTDSIILTDVQTVLAGVLTDDQLHWTKDNSPYRVEASILCPEGKTLIIDPGVEIRFTGDYYLKVNGCIQAIGTTDERIVFTKSDDCEASTAEGQWIGDEYVYPEYYWRGLQIYGDRNLVMQDTYTYVSGNTLQYCDVEYANTPISISRATFMNFCDMKDNNLNSLSTGSSSLIMNCSLNSGINESSGGGLIYNNKIERYLTSVCYQNPTIFKNNTLSNLTYFGIEHNGNFQNNIILSCNVLTRYSDSYDAVNFNNNVFEDCSGILVDAHESYSSCKSIDFTHNYWGAANTEEMELKGNNANLTFITDYYDNFENARVDYSDWATEPIETAGYLGDKFIDFELSINDSTSPSEPSDANVTVAARKLYGNNDLSQAKFALTESELKSASWGSLSQTITLDYAKTKDGYATVYAQVKDSAGNTSSIKSISFVYDLPVIEINDTYNGEDCIVDGATISGTSTSEKIYWTVSDKGRFNKYEAKLNGNIVTSDTYHYGGEYGWENESLSYSLNPSLLPAGKYEFTITATDLVGKVTTKTINFIIEGVTINTDYLKIPLDTSIQLNYSWGPLDTDVSLTSSDESIATISSSGVITGINAGTATITASVNISGQTFTDTCEIYVVRTKLYDFATGEIDADFFFPDTEWTLDNTTYNQNGYSLKSAKILGNEQTSALITAGNSTGISFYAKVSSEGSFDKLQFYIDDVQQQFENYGDYFGGEYDWQLFTYSLEKGEHTFRWTYSKDGGGDTGSDCVWIDTIIIEATE